MFDKFYFCDYDEENTYLFKGAVLSIDGQEMLTIEKEFSKEEYQNKGREFAEELLAQGAGEMIKQIKEEIGQR